MPEIRLERVCGCVDTWQVSACDESELVVRSPALCIPEGCFACQARGTPCAPRQDLTRMENYRPVEWSEFAGAFKRKSRMRDTGTKEWESLLADPLIRDLLRISDQQGSQSPPDLDSTEPST